MRASGALCYGLLLFSQTLCEFERFAQHLQLLLSVCAVRSSVRAGFVLFLKMLVVLPGSTGCKACRCRSHMMTCSVTPSKPPLMMCQMASTNKHQERLGTAKVPGSGKGAIAQERRQGRMHVHCSTYSRCEQKKRAAACCLMLERRMRGRFQLEEAAKTMASLAAPAPRPEGKGLGSADLTCWVPFTAPAGGKVLELRPAEAVLGRDLCMSTLQQEAARRQTAPVRVQGPLRLRLRTCHCSADHRTKEVVLEPAQLDSPGQAVEWTTLNVRLFMSGGCGADFWRLPMGSRPKAKRQPFFTIEVSSNAVAVAGNDQELDAEGYSGAKAPEGKESGWMRSTIVAAGSPGDAAAAAPAASSAIAASAAASATASAAAAAAEAAAAAVAGEVAHTEAAEEAEPTGPLLSGISEV